MLGAHLDCWHGGTGATDNAAGSAVMMEAMRILKTLNLKMDRTVRMGLWGGEEEGLLGSKAYVKEHFGDPRHHEDHRRAREAVRVFQRRQRNRKDPRRVSAGQRHDAADFRGLVRAVQGSDGRRDHDPQHRRHGSSVFDAVGLPGFQFIQDPMDYNSRTHHSNMDVYDRIQKGDMMQMSAIVASFVYNTAMREEMLPRKPLPPPQPPAGEGRGGAPTAQGNR